MLSMWQRPHPLSHWRATDRFRACEWSIPEKHPAARPARNKSSDEEAAIGNLVSIRIDVGCIQPESVLRICHSNGKNVSRRNAGD